MSLATHAGILKIDLAQGSVGTHCKCYLEVRSEGQGGVAAGLEDVLTFSLACLHRPVIHGTIQAAAQQVGIIR